MLMCSMSNVFGQDSLLNNATDTLPGVTDSLKSSQFICDHCVARDTFPYHAKYGAEHMAFDDSRKNLVYLYGNAFVEYEQFSIRNADYIEVDLNTNIATTRILPDSLKHLMGNTVYDTVVTQIVDTSNLDEEEYQAFGDQLEEVEIDPFTGEPVQPALEDRLAQTVEGDGALPGHKPGTPVFSDGTNEFDADEMRYNFKTGKGKVYHAVTFQSNLCIHG